MIGNSGVGKSNLMMRYILDDFMLGSQPTTGIETGNRVCFDDGKEILASVWDTCGQDRYRSITRSYYRNAFGAVLVYDISNRDSFMDIEKWYQDFRYTTGKHTPILLIGNKTDLINLRSVETWEGEKYASQRGMDFVELSALDSLQSTILREFDTLVSSIHKKVKAGSLKLIAGRSTIRPFNPDEQRKCCSN